MNPQHSMPSDVPVFGITGWKNSGKTTLTTQLITEFTERGYRVASIKHAHHAFDIDKPGTDSHQHRQAGAQEVAVVGGQRWAILNELRGAPEPPLAEVIARLSPCDLILVEGYKKMPHPKIECRRMEGQNSDPIPDQTGSIKAIATDTATLERIDDADGRPVFSLGDTKTIADFIADYLRLKAPAIPAQQRSA